LTGNSPPEICSWVVEFGYTGLFLGLAVVFDNAGDFAFNILEGIERDVGDLVLNAVLLKPEATTSEQDISFTSSWEIGDTVANENDQWGFLVRVAVRSLCPCFLNGSSFIVTEIGVILPNNFPLTPILRDQSVVGDNVDVFCLLTDEFIENSAEDRLETGGYNVEWDLAFDTEIMEFPEIWIHLELLLHDFEAVVERDIQTTPHLLGSIAEGKLATVDSSIELFASVFAAAMSVKKDVS